MHAEVVLFDLFNTILLVESDEVFYEPCLKKLHEFLLKNGINVPFETFKQVYFTVRDTLYAETKKSLEEPHFNVRVSQTLQRFGYYFDLSNPIILKATEAFTSEFMRYVHAEGNVTEILQKLHGKYKLGIVSNFAIPECVWKLLNKFALTEFFDVILISAEINQRKPSAKIFEKALEGLGVDASKAVFVGDTLDLDVKGAKNVGIKAILLERRPTDKSASVKPDKVIKSLEELLDVLEDC